jgi:hypothetical protein
MTANEESYTQGRTAGDFLSSRKAARAERYTRKTTAATLDGVSEVMGKASLQCLYN